MISRLSTALLAIALVAILLTCPFVRKTRKGLLFAHYALIYAAHAWDSNELGVGMSVTTVLVSSAMLAILIEHALTLNEKETVFQSVHDALPFAGTIVCLDSIAILLHRHAFAIGNILFAVGILFVTSYLKTNPRKTTLEVPIEELETMAEGTLFFDLENPLNCLGRNGWMLVCLMILELFIGLVPYFSSKEIRSLFIVAECICTWMILTLPVIVGGLVQTVKLVGRHIVEVQLHRHVVEAEKKDREGGQKRRREELLASVEEIFGDESVLPELI